MPTATDDRTGLLALSQWAGPKVCCACITTARFGINNCSTVWPRKIMVTWMAMIKLKKSIFSKHYQNICCTPRLHHIKRCIYIYIILWSSSGFLWNRYKPFCTLYKMTWVLFSERFSTSLYKSKSHHLAPKVHLLASRSSKPCYLEAKKPGKKSGIRSWTRWNPGWLTGFLLNLGDFTIFDNP